MIDRLLICLAFLFPFAHPLTADQKTKSRELDDKTKELIETARWDKSPASALAQASRVMDSELDRRRTAEGKATTYLAVLAALVPITLAITAAEWDHKTGPAPEWLRLLILMIAIVYIGAAGWYAFKALRVTGIHVIGVYDLALAWQGADGQEKLAKATAQHIRASHTAINAKVTAIKVTHAHLIRAFIFFITLLLLDPVTHQLQAIGIIQRNDVQSQSKEKVQKQSGADTTRPETVPGPKPDRAS